MATSNNQDSSDSNPFIRFKNHIDNNIQRGFETIFGPSMAMGRNYREEMSDSNLDRASTWSKQESSSPGNSNNDEGSAGVKDVLSWATSSPYSPLNLQDLPQPQPNDAPHGYPESFTFRDAFEDLLAVNSGQPISDLHSSIFAKHVEEIRYFPFGMPVSAWVTELGRRGLWDAYFPLSSKARRKLAWADISRRRMWETGDMTFRQPQIDPRPGALRPVLPLWEPHSPEWRHRGWAKCKDRASKRETETAQKQQQQQQQEADSEGDLYDAIESDFATESQAAITPALRKPLDDKPSSTQNSSSPDFEKAARYEEATGYMTPAPPKALGVKPKPQDSEEAPATRTYETPDGGKIVETTQKRTRGGKNEMTTTTEQYDAHGNLVSHRKSTRTSWSWEYPRKDRGRSRLHDEDDKEDASTVTKETKSSGWFWT
ncbi:hypothetical protein F4819DRAFT_204869 [Hypoxylon fuscum]|nr:hypothetical protein F4819DRAFT_204869 [Hypoxylon fuscum]